MNSVSFKGFARIIGFNERSDIINTNNILGLKVKNGTASVYYKDLNDKVKKIDGSSLTRTSETPLAQDLHD